MEISSLTSQQTLIVNSAVDDRGPVANKANDAAQNTGDQTVGEDLVDLIRNQNLASLPQEQLDLSQAQQVLQQLQQSFSQMDRQGLGDLFQYDGLRDLCAQVQQGEF